MNKEYHEQRVAFLRHARHMIGATSVAPWDVAIQHDTKYSDRIVGECMSSVNAMAGALTGALDRLIEGAELDSICDARSLCGYSRPLFPDDA